MPTPATTTTALADISQYLWSVRLLQQNAFNNGSLSMNNGRDLVLMVENAALSYGIANNLSGLEGVNNGVYTLCSALLQQANEILSTGSGGIVPTPSGGNTSTIYYPINVTLDGSEISGMTITNVAWRNLIQLSPTMTLNDTQFTYLTDYSYSILNGTFTFYSYNPQVGDSIGTFGFRPIT